MSVASGRDESVADAITEDSIALLMATDISVWRGESIATEDDAVTIGRDDSVEDGTSVASAADGTWVDGAPVS